MIDLNAIAPEDIVIIVVNIISYSVSQGVNGIPSMVIVAAPLTQEPSSYQLLSHEWWFSRLPEETLD